MGTFSGTEASKQQDIDSERKMDMKKLACLVLAVALALALSAACIAEEAAQIANPWTETTAEALLENPGVEFGIPEGAENIRYFLLEDEGLAEMQFTWYGIDYVARIKPAAEYEDISGMHYDAWDDEFEDDIGGCAARTSRVQDGDNTVDLCQWFAAVPGMMYSVSVVAPDLDGFDITAAAEQLYVPLQGDS